MLLGHSDHCPAAMFRVGETDLGIQARSSPRPYAGRAAARSSNASAPNARRLDSLPSPTDETTVARVDRPFSEKDDGIDRKTGSTDASGGRFPLIPFFVVPFSGRDAAAANAEDRIHVAAGEKFVKKRFRIAAAALRHGHDRIVDARIEQIRGVDVLRLKAVCAPAGARRWPRRPMVDAAGVIAAAARPFARFAVEGQAVAGGQRFERLLGTTRTSPRRTVTVLFFHGSDVKR